MMPNQSPVQQVPSTFASRVKWPWHVLTIHLHQVLKLRQSGAIPLSPSVCLHGFVYRLNLYLFTCDENVYYHCGNDGYTFALT